MKRIIILLFAIFSTSLYGQSELVQKVIQRLGKEGVRWQKDLVAEKIVPYSNHKSIIVLPEIVEEGEGYFKLKTWILLVDNTTAQIISKTFVFQE